MRLPGSEKLEIIRLVEQSHLPARRTLEMLGVLPSTFYRWYDRYRAGGPEALEDKLVCTPDLVPSVRSESGYFRSLSRRCGDGTEGEVDRRDHRLLA